MSEIKVFEKPEFGTVRTIVIDNEVWFVGKDVAEILGYSNPRKALTDHVDEGDKKMGEQNVTPSIIDSLGRTQYPTWINESGVYSLILSSKLPKAKEFKHWVTSEILPSVRKQGAYITPEKLEEFILNPDMIIKLCIALKEERDKNSNLQIANSQLTVDNQIMKPKADYFDELVERNLLTNFRDTAKQFQIKEKEFIKILIDKKFIYRDKKGNLKPYAKKNEGLFEVKECCNDKTKWCGTQTLITPKGRETFRILLSAS